MPYVVGKANSLLVQALKLPSQALTLLLCSYSVPPADSFPLSTTSELPGHALSDTTGIATGTVSFALPLADPTKLSELLEDWKEKAKEEMIKVARRQGASGVVDLDYKIQVVASGVGVQTLSDLARS